MILILTKKNSSKQWLLTLTIPLAITFFAACNGGEPPADETMLAKVGEQSLTVEGARQEIPSFMFEEDSVSALYMYREDWVERRIMVQEAERLQLDQNEEVQRRLQRLREEVLIEALKDHITARADEDAQVTDEEARNYYQEHKDQFVLDEDYVRFRHFAGTDMESAQTARQQLMRGIEWEEVAREYGVNGEQLIDKSEDFWPRSMALSDLEELNSYLQRIGIMEITPIRLINGQYHFVQLVETRAQGEHPDLDWLLDEIKDWLIIEKRRRNFNSYVKNLYLEAESNNEIELTNVLDTNLNTNSKPTDSLELLEETP